MISNVPHTSGAEPRIEAEAATQKATFPTPVGLNRSRRRASNVRSHVPHTSGAEPLILKAEIWFLKRSPHQWG